MGIDVDNRQVTHELPGAIKHGRDAQHAQR